MSDLPHTPASSPRFTPTYSSPMNLVERWFSEPATKWLRRGTHTSTTDLKNSINNPHLTSIGTSRGDSLSHWQPAAPGVIHSVTGSQPLLDRVPRLRASGALLDHCWAPLAANVTGQPICGKIASPELHRRSGEPALAQRGSRFIDLWMRHWSQDGLELGWSNYWRHLLLPFQEVLV